MPQYEPTHAEMRSQLLAIGQVLGQPARAAQYLSYLNDTTRMVTTDLAGLSPSDRPRVVKPDLT